MFYQVTYPAQLWLLGVPFCLELGNWIYIRFKDHLNCLAFTICYVQNDLDPRSSKQNLLITVDHRVFPEDRSSLR